MKPAPLVFYSVLVVVVVVGRPPPAVPTGTIKRVRVDRVLSRTPIVNNKRSLNPSRCIRCRR